MSDDSASQLPDSYAPAPAREGLTDVQMTICRRLMEGESMVAICRDDGMPARSTVFEWLATQPEFQRAYILAKQLLAETFADEIVAISDDASRDWIETEDGKVLDHEHVQRSRLRVDSRKWLASKLAPKRYGDSASLRVGGLDAGADREMTDDERAVRLAAILSAAEKRRPR